MAWAEQRLPLLTAALQQRASRGRCSPSSWVEEEGEEIRKMANCTGVTQQGVMLFEMCCLIQGASILLLANFRHLELSKKLLFYLKI